MKRLLLLTYILASSLYAQKTAFDPDKSNGRLFQYSEYVNVENSDFSIDEILQISNFNYKSITSENHDFGFTSDTYWVRFKLKNSSVLNKVYYLETARPITDIANLYQISEGIDLHKSGDQMLFTERDVAQRQTIFKILLPPKSENQFYLQLKSDGETTNLPLNLYSESAFITKNYNEQLFLGLFYGVLLLAGLIYLFFYTSLKNKAFLYYGIYVFSIGLMQAALDGFIYQYFLPNGGYLNSRMVLIAALSSNFFLLKYCEYFLNVRVNLPRYLKAYNLIYIVLALLFIMVLVSEATLELAYPLSNLNGLLSLILIIATGFSMRFNKIKIDRFFSIGIFFLVVGLLGFVMNNLGFLPSNFYTLNSSKFGSGFEVIFLSLSMTNLLKRLREEKEKSQKTALKKSEEISELKSFFMSNMSHELRTPINAIMGMVDSELASECNSEEERKKYQVIRNATVSLLSNVNDVLDFEKIETNQLKLRHEEFNPSLVLNQISENWKSEAHKKGLKYYFEIDTEIPTTVVGDSDRLVQIVNNVLGNAVKFTHRGDVMFKLKCLKQPNEICRFSFRISDSGIGMDDKAKNHVFDSFSQMRLNHKRKFGGIGLGLTIAKHLVMLFEGTIKIDSKLNEGTDIFIDIPLKEINRKRDTLDVDHLILEESIHLLVVEDNKLNQMVMRKFLSSYTGVTFSIAENGKEAIKALKNNVYNLILMDLQMPVMDGYEATELIRGGTLGGCIKNIPIIAVTADTMDETRQRVLELGMNDYMAKPVKRDVLLKKIKYHIQSGKLSVA